MINFTRTKSWTIYPKPGVCFLVARNMCICDKDVMEMAGWPDTWGRSLSRRSASPRCTSSSSASWSWCGSCSPGKRNIVVGQIECANSEQCWAIVKEKQCLNGRKTGISGHFVIRNDDDWHYKTACLLHPCLIGLDKEEHLHESLPRPAACLKACSLSSCQSAHCIKGNNSKGKSPHTVHLGCKVHGFVKHKLTLYPRWPYICGP